MNKTLTFLGLAGGALLVGAVLTMTLTNAEESAGAVDYATQGHRGSMMGKRSGGMHQHLLSVLEEGSFADFQNAVAGTPLAEQISTEEQFASFKQMHDLMQAGNVEEAQTIAERLGLSQFGASKRGMQGEGSFQAYREEIRNAVEGNDFAAFQAVLAGVDNHPLSSIDTPEAFATLVQIHALRQEAETLEEGLGIQKGHLGMKGGKGGHACARGEY